MINSISGRRGISLIEVVLVIVILGMLAAVAIPKLFNITGDAQTAATNGAANALASAATENYAVRTENNSKGQAVTNCKDVGNLLQGGLLTGYSISSLAIAAGTTATCTLNGPAATTATFTANGIS